MKKNKIIDDYKAVIFFFFFSLVDSMWVWDKVDEEFLGKRGFAVPKDYQKTIQPMGLEKVADYTIERFNLKDSKESVLKEWHDMAVDAYATRVKLKPGARRYIEYLREKKVIISVATSNGIELVEKCLKGLGIYECFHSITTASEVSRGKGFPDIYDKSCSKMGIDKNKTIVFEDILEAIKGAKDGGYTVIAMEDEGSLGDKVNIKKISDGYIKDFREMIN